MVETRPVDPAAQFAMRLQKLERTVAALAISRRAPFTEVYDDDGNRIIKLSAAGLEFFDASGNRLLLLDPNGLSVHSASGTQRMLLGLLSPSVYGLTLKDAAGTTELTRIATDGTTINSSDGTQIIKTDPASTSLINPDFMGTWEVREAGDQRVTTSSTFETAWAQSVGRLYHDVLLCTLVVNADASTTGEIRVRELVTGNSTTAESITGGGTRELQWLHGVALDTIGRLFVVEIRRTSGTGNVSCRPDSQMIWTSSETVPTATSSGNWI